MNTSTVIFPFIFRTIVMRIEFTITRKSNVT